MERCPVCRARVRDSSPCPRCGADLTTVLGIEVRRQTLEREAVHRLKRGDLSGASDLVARAQHLQRTSLNLLLPSFIQYLRTQGMHTQAEL
jgi:hypothetical protein